MTRKKPEELRSHRWFGVQDLRAFGHRSRIKQIGFDAPDYAGKPVIGIINTWSDINHCHTHFKQRVEDVKRGVYQAGGFPLELPAISLAEPIVKPTTMMYRNFLAMETEELLRSHPACAESLAKYRINPGNVGRGSKRDTQFAEMIETACRYGRPVRIGVNWGSLDTSLLTRLMDENSRLAEPLDANDVMREAIVVSALESALRAEELGLPGDRIVISCKVSAVQDLISVYRSIAGRCDYPLHLGLTEAGMGSKGIVASTAAMSVLLQEGIGDTIRVSLTPEPGGDRTREVVVAQEILQTMGLRSFTPLVIACPGCGRTTSTYFQELAQKIQSHLRDRMPQWRDRYAGVEQMSVAVMGCVVNGPGDSKHADIGISLPGTGERPVAPVYIDGEKGPTLKGEGIAEEFQQLVEAYVERRYGKGEN